MKFDQETLIKQRFWVLLGAFVLFWLISTLVIEFSTASAGEVKRKAFEESRKKVDAAKKKSPKNNSFNIPWNEHAEKFRKEKNGVWSAAWAVQEGMYNWPENVSAPLNQLKYYDDAFPPNWRLEYKNEVWKQQFEGLEKGVEPVEFSTPLSDLMNPTSFTGGGASGGGGKMGGMKLTPPSGSGERGGPPGSPTASASSGGGMPDIWAKVPTIEECWLAQEDFWVKRELLNIVRDTLISVGQFRKLEPGKDVYAYTNIPVKPETGADLPAGVIARHTLRNDLWEVELLFMKAPSGSRIIVSDASTIRNIHPAGRTQKLAKMNNRGGLVFAVEQDQLHHEIVLEGLPLAWNVEPVTFRRISGGDKPLLIAFDSFKPNKPYEMKQVFDWSTAPIRTIENIRLGQNSHRTAKSVLKAGLAFPPDAPAAATADTTAPVTSGQTPPGPPPGLNVGPPGGGKTPMGGAAAGGNQTPNGIERNRYLFVTEQCRFLPVGMLLVVDQAHIHDVLVAMANSKLRIQTTQVQYRHVTDRHSTMTTIETGAAAGGLGKAGGARMPGVPVGAQLGGREGGISGPPGPGGAPGAVAAPTGPENDPNLVELGIYGIATLYERYPPKKSDKDAQSAGTPTVTTTPQPAAGTPAPAGPTDKSTDKSTAKPTEPSTAKPADKSTAKPAEPSTEKPADKSTAKPAEPSTEKPGKNP